MCGIAGILDFGGRPVTSEELSSMCDAMRHRGPDDEGHYLGNGVGLGMRRLRIIDLETGHQPIRNEDGSIWVVLNGEIYNYRELRRTLEQDGHMFYTASDTETIAHLYEKHEIACARAMRGMFAFAVWDERRRTLLLARDRLGIKPLYYTVVNGRLIFASELKSILQIPEVRRELNWQSVDHLFTFSSTPHSESIIEGVHKVEPGHILIASRGKIQVERYWQVQFRPEPRPQQEIIERLRALLREAVGLHLISDVPLGAFLSGGVDSSSIVALARDLTSAPIKTFSIGFDDSAYDELEYARVCAKTFGTEHHELVLKPDALDILDDLIWCLDEPLGDSSVIPTYMVSRLAAEHVTVVLSGDGGDELFAGYDKYLVEERERRVALPLPVRRALRLLAGAMPDGMRGRNFIRHFSLEGFDRYLDAQTAFRRADKRSLFSPEVYGSLSECDPWRGERDALLRGGPHWLSALQALDLRSYLPLDILTKVDRMSMAHSIEARVPLLDHHVVEFAATIPPDLQLSNGTTKYLFKQAMRGLVPDGILDRPKHGFAVPLRKWLNAQEDFIPEILSSQTSRQRGIFNMAYIDRLVSRYERGRDLDGQLWTLICFELWCRIFLDQRRSGRSSSASLPIALGSSA